ncbi:MAG: 23S rRNA (guanosine(2251)-2'-O)-methyltransferase RlmB [Lachnospiraceae bacterium]|nr:23S rRNA (guanosine(2251)-2'-O)-methyltransferase RlmB [Lachnospiraceae bacterium]
MGREEDTIESMLIEGRNEVIEALRSGRSIDRLYMQDGAHDGKLDTIRREAKKAGLRIDFVEKKRLDDLSETGRHQGVVARAAAYGYASVDDILSKARERGEDPFIFILDGIEDPHNLGAIIRTADQAGAHGVIIAKDRAVGLTAVVAKASAGALNYVPVAKVTNIARTIEELKKEGLWFAGADMDGDVMYEKDLKGSIGIVIGAEGRGLSKLVREACDYIVSIPSKGHIDSLNASVAAGVLAYEIVRRRGFG